MGIFSFSFTLAAVLLQLRLATAETNLQQQILSTVVYVLNGDHTPYVWPILPELTPLGAHQLYNAGTSFRNRYIVPSTDPSFVANTGIMDISPYQLSANDINILSTNDQYIVASAQAFMQGLYPPLVANSNYTYIAGLSPLSNGTNVVAPLDGYQYPLIYTAADVDMNSIWVSGSDQCPNRLASVSEYFSSGEYYTLENDMASFYTSLEPILLDGTFPTAEVGYFDAYYIWDYLNYASIHNVSAFTFLRPQDLNQARDLATDWIFTLYGNTTASGTTSGDHIRAIAGRTFAYHVIQSFYTNIDTQGEYDKMNLVFGGLETMIAFEALAQLSATQHPEFSLIPDPGSTMVFELFSMLVDDDGSYPDVSDLYVRFLFQNGTSDTSELLGYPLFGRDDSEIIIPFADFLTGMENFMTLSVEDWCTTCNSYSVFCPAFDDIIIGPSTPSSSTSGSGGLHPAIAGVIGAAIALAVFALVIAALMFLGGVRVYRKKVDRRSDLSGFKGAEKLASDQDLAIAKGGAGATIINAEGAAPIRGHERVGSWELRDQAKAEEGQMPAMNAPQFVARRPSYEDDDLRISPYETPVKPHQHV